MYPDSDPDFIRFFFLTIFKHGFFSHIFMLQSFSVHWEQSIFSRFCMADFSIRKHVESQNFGDTERVLNLLLLECCNHLVFWLNNLWITVPAYFLAIGNLFIFTITEISEILRYTRINSLENCQDDIFFNSFDISKILG